jgi:sugar phosphate isomerase/epimerase
MLQQTVVTRRAALGTAALAAAAKSARAAKEWRPKLGALGPYTDANIEFVRQEGFNSMVLNVRKGTAIDPDNIDDAGIARVKSALARAGIFVSALQASSGHIDPDPGRRARVNAAFAKSIEIAGKLGVPYVGTSSGKDESKPYAKQIDEIVRVYNEKYFPACEKYEVKILWEPYPGGANLATSPAGFEALFKAFNNSPWVGLQYDPSHLVWQMMDPIQTARDFIDKIFDVHLKDTEIRWPILRKVGINPPDKTRWWRYRLPGLGSIDWAAFFTVLQDAGYQGAMNIEHEDPLYGAPSRPGPDFSEDFKNGFRMAHRYLRQYVPV